MLKKPTSVGFFYGRARWAVTGFSFHSCASVSLMMTWFRLTTGVDPNSDIGNGLSIAIQPLMLRSGRRPRLEARMGVSAGARMTCGDWRRFPPRHRPLVQAAG